RRRMSSPAGREYNGHMGRACPSAACIAERAETVMTEPESPLFRPLTVRSLDLRNRIVMSPMTRSHSPGGVPGADVVEYYRRRAAGGTALIVTEGVAIDHPTAVDNPRVPHMYGEEALEGWRRVV